MEPCKLLLLSWVPESSAQERDESLIPLQPVRVRGFQPRRLGSALDVHRVCEANICYSSILICSLKCFKSLECKVLPISSVPLQDEIELLDVPLAVKADCILGCDGDSAAGCGFSSPGTLEGTHLSTEGPP